MRQAHGSDLWKEPAANGGTPTVAQMFLTIDGAGDWTFTTVAADRDGTFEDDGSGDFRPYTTATLPGLNTQLVLLSVRSDITAYEVAP